MRTIETTATVSEDGILTVYVPVTLPPGSHRVVLVVDEATDFAAEPLDLPVHRRGPWPEDLSLRREDLYGDWGR
jgi:hypothetical protein